MTLFFAVWGANYLQYAAYDSDSVKAGEAFRSKEWYSTEHHCRVDITHDSYSEQPGFTDTAVCPPNV